MRSFTPFLNGLFTATFLAVAMGSANAQSARKFGNKSPVVRLCPATCTAVNGHGFKAGASTTVYETKSGWARVSGYLDRAKLVASFGDSTPAKPALWVPVSSLASTARAAAPAKKPAAKKKPVAKAAKKQPRRVSVIDRLARLRNPALPSFRPGTVVASAPATVQQTEVEVVETPAVETPAVETPIVEAPVVETPVAEAPKVAAQPVVVDTQGGSQKALTWEEVQAKIARQKAGVVEPVKPVVTATQQDDSKADEQAAAKKAAERKAALKAAALEREAKLLEANRLKQEAQKKRAAENKQKQQEAEAKRLADEKAAKAAKAKADAEAKKVADAKKAAEAKKVADAKKAEEAKAAADKAAKTSSSETPVALGADGKAIKLPPLASSVTKTEPVVETPKPVETAAVVTKTETASVTSVEGSSKPAGPEPTFTTAEADPIDFGKRPKKLTKALLDKRLRKLPGRKSKVKREVVIAMRHSALGLLKSGECKGIAGGGQSAVPGMFYITCTEDPGYLRQFPIVEESW